MTITQQLKSNRHCQSNWRCIMTPNLTPALTAAENLVAALREAHSEACKSDEPFAYIVMLDALERAAELRGRLASIVTTVESAKAQD